MDTVVLDRFGTETLQFDINRLIKLNNLVEQKAFVDSMGFRALIVFTSSVLP